MRNHKDLSRIKATSVRTKKVAAYLGYSVAIASLKKYRRVNFLPKLDTVLQYLKRTATAGSDVVQSGRPIFDDFFQHLWPHIGNNTANVVFQMVKRLWLIRIDQ
ncbi:hypothetical protein TNCV_4870991 [Trichonephila clavipes]|nr:hypothetical protein TNCV_4870991 [Trichonephila clavipes]